MRIAQVAPLFESVPPGRYGGTERIVSYLTEELVRLGHDVTLFASADSKTSAKLVPQCKRSLRLDADCRDPIAAHIVMIEEVLQRAAEFDVIHFHVDYLHFSVARRLETPHLTTLHGRLDLADLPALYRTFSDVPVNSISEAQRKPLPEANYVGTVYHGVPKGLYTCEESPDSYLVFIGRVSPEKGLGRAIEIAKQARLPLKIGAKVDKTDREYYEREIEPALHDPSIEFLDEVDDREKQQLIGKAAALLFPIDWPEPFGIVMIEAMACGTPVIAFPRGAVLEVIDDGVTGFVVHSEEQAVKAIKKLPGLSRNLIRQIFERRFSSTRMAQDYIALYKKLRSARTMERVEVTQCL